MFAKAAPESPPLPRSFISWVRLPSPPVFDNQWVADGGTSCRPSLHFPHPDVPEADILSLLLELEAAKCRADLDSAVASPNSLSDADVATVPEGEEAPHPSGCRKQGAGCATACKVQEAGTHTPAAGSRVQGAGCRVQGAGCTTYPVKVQAGTSLVMDASG
jgi:hypothetical protein